MKQGDVHWVDLNPREAREIDKIRPCVIVSCDDLHAIGSPYVWIVPLTSTTGRNPFHIPVQPPEGGIKNASSARVEQLRSIDVDRIKRRIGKVSTRTLYDVLDRAKIILGV